MLSPAVWVIVNIHYLWKREGGEGKRKEKKKITMGYLATSGGEADVIIAPPLHQLETQLLISINVKTFRSIHPSPPCFPPIKKKKMGEEVGIL